MICNNELAGIVSFGMGCASQFTPNVYTDVSRYRDFIDSSMKYIGGEIPVMSMSCKKLLIIIITIHLVFSLQ